MSEIEKLFREKAKDKADEIIEEVKADPVYFIMQGGSDGTWAHDEFWYDYGYLMPEIAKLAAEIEPNWDDHS